MEYDIESHRQKVIDAVDRYEQIIELECGYKFFWVKDHGAFSAGDLRIIADEIDRRNKDWDDQVKRELDPMNEESK